MVYLTTELGEEVDVCVQASSPSEAEAIGMTMLEGGELQCDGVMCMQCSAVLASKSIKKLQIND